MRDRIVVERRDAHQAVDRRAHARCGSARRRPPPRPARRPTSAALAAGVDLHEERAAFAPAAAISSPAPRRASRGRANEWRRRAPPPRAPCWSAADRSDAGGGRDSARAAPATCAAPPARGSRRTPAAPPASTGSIAAASNVFDTAISVTSAGSRPARCADSAMRVATAASLARASSIRRYFHQSTTCPRN